MVNVSEIDENYIIKNSHDLSSESKLTKLINDVSQATKVETVTGEAIILAAGAAGTTGKIRIGYAPIMDSIGGRIGYYRASTDKDSSLVLSSTALATGQKPLVDGATETGIYSALTNGTYSVDYVNGIIYYKKGTTGTTGTVNYKYTGQEVDLSGSTITIGAVDAKGVYNATEPTLTDGEKAQLQLNENGELKVTGGAGASSVSAEYISPSDFTATYTSSSSITLSGVPISINDSSQIAYIKQVKADNTSRTYVNGANDITLAHASGVITIYEKGTAAASLVAGDVYEVGINGTTKAYDISTDAQKTISLVNVWNRYTDPEVLVTAQDLTDAYADYGAVIDMRGYTHLRLGIVLDVNDSTDITLKPLGLNEAGGIDKFEIEGGTTQAIPHTADAKYSYEFDVKGSPFVQLQAKAETVGATPGDLTVYITKQFKN